MTENDAELIHFQDLHSDQATAKMKDFELQGRVHLIEIPLHFCDIAAPAILCKSAPAVFSITKTSCDMLMLTNDGRIISPLATLRPVCAPSAVNSFKMSQPSRPEWLRPLSTSEYCEFHRHCTTHVIQAFDKDGKHGFEMTRISIAAETAILEPPIDVRGQRADVEREMQRQQHQQQNKNQNSLNEHNQVHLGLDVVECASDPSSLVNISHGSSSIVDAVKSKTGGIAASNPSSEQFTNPNVDLNFASLNLREIDVSPDKDPASIVAVEFLGNTANCGNSSVDEDAECHHWLQFLNNLRKKMVKKNLNPLPVFTRGLSLQGFVQCSSGASEHPAYISVTSEGFFYQEHMQLCSRSFVDPEDNCSIRLRNVLVATVNPTWSSAESIVKFKDVEHRDASLQLMRHIIAHLLVREQQSVSLLSSIEARLQPKTAIEHDLSHVSTLLTLLSPLQSPVLAALDFPYEGPAPPIMPQLIRTIRMLYDQNPAVMLEAQRFEALFPGLFQPGSIKSRPLHLLIRSGFGAVVQARAVYWLIFAVAHGAPAALRVKDCRASENVDCDDDYEDCEYESTLLETLIFSKQNKIVLRDHDFPIQTLQMLLRVDFSLASDLVFGDCQGETVFSRICSDLGDASDMFHRNAYKVIHSLLQSCPSLARERIPSRHNRLPIHMLCDANPMPCELQLLLDAFPESASMGDNDGFLPIHLLIQNTSFTKCVEMLLAAAPHCMSHHTRQGLYPLHMINDVDRSNTLRLLNRKKREKLLSAVVRSCYGRIVCDFAPNMCKALLNQFVRWVDQGNACEHYSLICNMNVLDISGCEMEKVLPASTIVDLLSKFLPHCTSLTILDISCNHFLREHIEAILPSIMQLPKLQCLNLDGCTI
jgi:hypothetical protein